VGDVLYKGPYNPQPHGSGGNYQNFTVTIPFNEDLIRKSLLTVNRFFLIGVSGFGLVVFSGSHADFSPRPRMERHCRVLVSKLRRSLSELFYFMIFDNVMCDWALNGFFDHSVLQRRRSMSSCVVPLLPCLNAREVNCNKHVFQC
jgi:hypothetical protein